MKLRIDPLRIPSRLLAFASMLTLAACGADATAPSDDADGSQTGVGADAGSGGGAGAGQGQPPAVTIYVAPNGDDAWSGKLAAPNLMKTDGPVKTLDRARAIVRGIDKTLAGPIAVMLRGGTYRLTAPVTFSAEDSGSATTEVVYESYPGETAVVSGGAPISGWTVPAPGRWVASVDPSKFGAFEDLFVGGERRYRPRTTKSSYLHHHAQPVLVDTKSSACNQQVGTQWECFDRFKYDAGDIDPTWAQLGGSYPAGDIEIDNFEKWTMAKLRIDHVDTVSQIVYLTGPTFANTQNNGFLIGHRYLVENVREALSQPGEWFLDRSSSPWKLTYLAKTGEDPTKTEVIAPELDQLIVAADLQHTTFRGLTFEHAAWAPAPEGHPSTQAEPTVGAALSFTGSSDITFDSDVIAHTGGWGLEFVGSGTARDRVTGCAFYDIGAGGVRIGQMAKATDTDDTVPHDNMVEETVVAGFGRVLPAGIGTGIWLGDAHDNTVTHNDVYDAYSGAIGVCVPTAAQCRGLSNSGGAFNNVISFNHGHDLGQGVTSDIGCIYVATEAATGNRVLNNRCHDIAHPILDPSEFGYGGNGIYLDNTTHGVDVESNLVYRVTQDGYINNSGPQSTNDAPNVVKNNVLVLGRLGTVQRSRETPAPALFFHFTSNVVTFDQGSVQRPGHWYCWNGPCSDIFDFSHNLYWRTDGGLATDASAFMTTNADGSVQTGHTFADWQNNVHEDPGSVIANPSFAAPGYPTDDYTIGNTDALAAIGFVPFDQHAPGRTSAKFVPPPVPAAFPTEKLDPKKDF